MNTTENLGLKMPETTDYRDIADLNYNMQVLDPIVYALYTHAIKNISVSGNTFTCTREDGSTFTVTHANASTSAAGLMSAADKTKLNGIAAGAQVNPGNATQGAAGLMSATDKAKLDGIATGAQVNWKLGDTLVKNSFLSADGAQGALVTVSIAAMYYIDITGDGKVTVDNNFIIADSREESGMVHTTAFIPLAVGQTVYAVHSSDNGSTKVYRLSST